MTSVSFGLFTLALIVPSVVLHELAHGYVSLRHGDPTARDAGRRSRLIEWTTRGITLRCNDAG